MKINALFFSYYYTSIEKSLRLWIWAYYYNKWSIGNIQTTKKRVPGNTFLQQVASAYQELNMSYKSQLLIKKRQLMESVPIEEISLFETKDNLSFLVKNKETVMWLTIQWRNSKPCCSPKAFSGSTGGSSFILQLLEKWTTILIVGNMLYLNYWKAMPGSSLVIE